MSSTVLLASRDAPARSRVPAIPVEPPRPADPRKVWLQTTTDTHPRWIESYDAFIMPGWKGHGMPPVELVTEEGPGIAGSWLSEVRVRPREVFLPIFLSGRDTYSYMDARTAFEQIVSPLQDESTLGNLMLCTQTHRGRRDLRCVYVDGMEGEEGGDTAGGTWATFGIRLLAVDPFWRDPHDLQLRFDVQDTSTPFLGVQGGTDAPWPTFMTSSTVLGQGMRIPIRSEVPVWPSLDLTGPMDSFVGSMDTGWQVEVPGGVPAGSTLTIVTDPRRKSIRLDGALAAGYVAIDSVFKPFPPGTNVLDVTAPGGTSATQLRLYWRGGYRSAW